DALLLQAYLSGDADAFAAIVARYEGALLAYARFLPGGEDQAEDVVQEVFLRLARTPPVLPQGSGDSGDSSRSRLAPWLYRVTRNCAMEQVRSETRRIVRERSAAAREAIAGGQATVDARDTHRAVERGLSELNQDQREVLVLRLLDDRSYREIAEITGKKTGTVAWLISEGLRSLSHTLSPVLALNAAAASCAPRAKESKGEAS
ncbi:MAG: RNA polymerase sigma factor, partial [Planctomycetota bacterium]